MRRIKSIHDVYKYCNPDGIIIVYSKTELFKTSYSKTAVVLQQMGILYYISCVAPVSTTVENLEYSPVLTMRAAPKLIRERLDYLAGRRAYVHPAAKNALYRALSATDELELLNDLEGCNFERGGKILPWGITDDACKLIREVYKLHHGSKDADPDC